MSLEVRFNNFKNLAQERFGGIYDFSESNYTTQNNLMWVRCKKHDIKFEQKPGNLLTGYSGCSLCATEKRQSVRSKTTDKFIQDAIRVHGNKYDYSLTHYVKWDEPVIIICPFHGEFPQEPNVHTSSGCGYPTCGKWSYALKGGMHNLKNIYEEKANLYLYEFKNDKYHFIKVGVTSKYPIHKRFKGSKYQSYHKTLLLEYNDLAINVLKLEQDCLLKFKDCKYFVRQEDTFKGCSELIKVKYKTEVLDYLKLQISSLNE